MGTQQHPPSIYFNQTIQMNHDVPVCQTSESPPTFRMKRPPPLQTITNSPKRRHLLNSKPMPPLQVPSSSSQQLAENRHPSSNTAPTVAENKPVVVDFRSNTSSNFSVLPWSPITTSKKPIEASHHIARYNWQGESAPVYPQNTANPASQNVSSALLNANPGRWTKEEDEVLAFAVRSEKGQIKSWDLIASKYFAGSRTGIQCKHRWKKVGIGVFESLST
mmetsp:Transcript_20177/g.49491  ORF Transcript_20177/g.49491 Transcript_20177/m.49491 type:complete len:220 (+) Transcript_20177:168-827(+)